jgi:hypothetical protein
LFFEGKSSPHTPHLWAFAGSIAMKVPGNSGMAICFVVKRFVASTRDVDVRVSRKSGREGRER